MRNLFLKMGFERFGLCCNCWLQLLVVMVYCLLVYWSLMVAVGVMLVRLVSLICELEIV